MIFVGYVVQRFPTRQPLECRSTEVGQPLECRSTEVGPQPLECRSTEVGWTVGKEAKGVPKRFRVFGIDVSRLVP
jgi:hypothetical protein